MSLIKKKVTLNTMPLSGGRFKDLGFQIMKFSDFEPEKLPEDIRMDTPHLIGFHLILFCNKINGEKGELNINYINIKLGQFEILFIPKGSIITMDISKIQQGFSLLFDDDFLTKNALTLSFSSAFWHLSKKEIIKLNKIESDNLNMFYKILYNEYFDKNETNKDLVIKTLVKALFFKLQKHIDDTGNNKQPLYSTFKVFETMLDNHNINNTVGYYCSKLGITEVKLNKICKFYCKYTAKQVLNLQLIFEAKKLLLFSDLMIKEIAYQLGFSEATNFIKFFKNKTLYTPNEFRKI